MRIISSRQPCYFPGIPLLQRILNSHVHVLSDDVKFTRSDYENRNYIKTSAGRLLLSVPVKATDTTLVKDVLIDNSTPWQAKHWRAITLAYSKAPFWNEFGPVIQPLFELQFETLLEFNLAAYSAILTLLRSSTTLKLASEIQHSGTGSDRVLSLCKTINADVYLAGTGARNYLNLEAFEQAQVKVLFFEPAHPIYPQRFGDFISGLSCLDLLFNCGVEKRIFLIN